MTKPGINFPSLARQALDNARAYEGMTTEERLEEIDALFRFAQSLLQVGADGQRRRQVAEEMERKEMLILAEVGRRGHV